VKQSLLRDGFQKNNLEACENVMAEPGRRFLADS